MIGMQPIDELIAICERRRNYAKRGFLFSLAPLAYSLACVYFGLGTPWISIACFGINGFLGSKALRQMGASAEARDYLIERKAQGWTVA